MRIGALHSTNYRTDYVGYEATGDKKTDEFYSCLSSAVEKSTTDGTGEVLGLTMIKYNDSIHYGMSATYSTASTEADPIVRISSNYGGEQRYYDVHVKDVDPKNASQLEMFALSCYQDDQGITDGGTYGSFTRMKVYASNAADIGKGIDLEDPDNASAKIDWVAMLKQMSQLYLQNSQTYSQYLDCVSLASKLENRSDEVNKTYGPTITKQNRLTWKAGCL